MAELDPQTLRDLSESIRDLNIALGNSRRVTTDLNRDFDQLRNRTEDVSDAISDEATRRRVNAELDRKEAQAKRDQEYARSRAYADADRALRNFTSAFKSSDESLSKYNSAIGSAGDAALNLGKSFGPLGTIIGGIVKGLTMFAEAAIKQADLSLKATDQLAKMGSAGQFTAEEVRKMGNEAGYTVENLSKLIKPIQNMGGSILMLGDTAAKGQKAFAQIANVGAEARMHFRALGISQEELTQSQADYIKLQQISGTTLNKPIKDIQNSSKDYVENLLTLSALTGKDIEQIKKEQELARSDIETQIKANLMDQEILRLKATGRQEDAAQLEKERDARNSLLDTVQATIGDDARRQVASYLATESYTEASKALLQMGIPMEKFLAQIKRGEDVSGDFTDAFVEGTDRVTRQFGYSGVYSEDLRKNKNMNAESYAAAVKFRGKTQADRLKQIQEDKERIAKEKDGAQIARNAMLEAENALKTSFEDLLGGVNPLMGAFNGLTGVVDALIDLIYSIPGMGDRPEKKEAGQEAYEEIQRVQAQAKEEGTEAYSTGSGKARYNELMAESSDYRANLEYREALKNTGWSYDLAKGGLLNPNGEHVSIDKVPEEIKEIVENTRKKRAKRNIEMKDKGGLVNPGELAIVGEYGPELLTGPAMVTGREQTTDIIRSAMQDFTSSAFRTQQSATQDFSKATLRSQQILNQRRMQELAEEKELELENLINMNASMDIASDSMITFSQVIYDIEEQLRSIFGTEEKPTTNPFDLLKDSLSGLFGLPGREGGGGSEGTPPVVPSDMSKLKNPEKLKEAMAYFMKQGWSEQQAAGIVGNLMAESGEDLKTNAVGDSGAAFGIAQWHPDRQAKFREVFNKDIRQSTLEEQLAFVDWELKNTEAKAGRMLRNARTSTQSAAFFDQYYERSSGEHRGKRMSYAAGLEMAFPADGERAVAKATPTPGNVVENIKADEKSATASTTPTAPVVTTQTVGLGSEQMIAVSAQGFTDLSTKMATMISKLEESNELQSRILRQNA